MKPEEVKEIHDTSKKLVDYVGTNWERTHALQVMRLCVEYARSEMQNAASADNIDWVNTWQSLLTKIKEAT